MKSCLIVDDSEVIRALAEGMLRELEFDCLEAEDGEAALAECRRGLPDAILLDWGMPRMDGLEFLRRLRALPGGAKPVVVLCTTRNKMDQIREAMAAGANEYIMKPFDAVILKSKLARVGLL